MLGFHKAFFSPFSKTEGTQSPPLPHLVPAAAKSLQSCPTLANTRTAAHQAPLPMGFSRQEYWSGVPLPSPTWQRQSSLKTAQRSEWWKRLKDFDGERSSEEGELGCVWSNIFQHWLHVGTTGGALGKRLMPSSNPQGLFWCDWSAGWL